MVLSPNVSAADKNNTNNIFPIYAKMCLNFIIRKGGLPRNLTCNTGNIMMFELTRLLSSTDFISRSIDVEMTRVVISGNAEGTFNSEWGF